jgi:endonuclease/exonuclease/phosphatase family metal-dependent hydrolase
MSTFIISDISTPCHVITIEKNQKLAWCGRNVTSDKISDVTYNTNEHAGTVSQVPRAGNLFLSTSKDSFYEELEQVFNHFPKYHMKILLGDFNAKLGREDIFKPTVGKESLHEDSNDNGVRVVNFATSKNLVVKSTMFPHQNVHKYTWTSPDGKTNIQIDHVLIDRRWHSSILDARSFRGADCDPDHYLVVAKVRERLSAMKQAAQRQV